MKRIKAYLFLVSLLMFLGTILRAQVANFDSLAVDAGFEKPLHIAQLVFSSEIDGNTLTGKLLTQFAIPGEGKVISHFGFRSGRMHTGTDLKMPQGDTIYAAFNGIVAHSKYYHGYGNLVVIQHENNLKTYYGHLSKFLVNYGSTVAKGQPIGLAGATGRATTSHLHFEIRENEQPYDPELVFDFKDKTIKPDIRMLASLAELDNKHSKNKLQVDESVSQKYVVRAGDSLWIISRRVKTTVETLCKLNNLTETAVLQIGQILNIY